MLCITVDCFLTHCVLSREWCFLAGLRRVDGSMDFSCALGGSRELLLLLLTFILLKRESVT